MHLFSADSYKDYLLEESHKMFNEINKTFKVCHKPNKCHLQPEISDVKLFCL